MYEKENAFSTKTGTPGHWRGGDAPPGLRGSVRASRGLGGRGDSPGQVTPGLTHRKNHGKTPKTAAASGHLSGGRPPRPAPDPPPRLRPRGPLPPPPSSRGSP